MLDDGHGAVGFDICPTGSVLLWSSVFLLCPHVLLWSGQFSSGPLNAALYITPHMTAHYIVYNFLSIYRASQLKVDFQSQRYFMFLNSVATLEIMGNSMLDWTHCALEDSHKPLELSDRMLGLNLNYPL